MMSIYRENGQIQNVLSPLLLYYGHRQSFNDAITLTLHKHTEQSYNKKLKSVLFLWVRILDRPLPSNTPTFLEPMLIFASTSIKYNSLMKFERRSEKKKISEMEIRKTNKSNGKMRSKHLTFEVFTFWQQIQFSCLLLLYIDFAFGSAQNYGVDFDQINFACIENV